MQMWEGVWQIGRHCFSLLHVLRCDIQVDRYGNNRQIFEHPVADTELLSLLNQRLAYYLDYRIKDLQAIQRNAMQCNAMQCNAMQCNAMHVSRCGCGTSPVVRLPLSGLLPFSS